MVVGAWRPLVRGEAAGRVRDVVARLARGLPDAPVFAPWNDEIPDPVPALIRRICLTEGLPGLALAHAYLARAGFGDRHGDLCESVVEETLDLVVEEVRDPSLSLGYVGVAWMLEHLGGNGAGEEESAGCVFDGWLARHLESEADVPFDLMHGLAGWGIYALERMPRPEARALLGAVVRKLEDAAEREPDRCAWRSRPDPRWTDPARGERHPRGWRDVGVFRGVPAVLVALAGAVAWGTEAERARSLALDGLRWVLDRRLPGGYAEVVEEEQPVRSGWCAGLAGVAATGWLAARSLGDADLGSAFLDLARQAAAETPEDDPERGPWLCHGFASQVHLFHRLSVDSGDDTFAAAALRWLDVALDAAEDVALDPPQPTGLLNGRAGVTLALLATLAEEEPAWDRALALSLRLPP